MDPNETLKRLRELGVSVDHWESLEFGPDRGEYMNQAAIEQAELFQALDQWIQKGGFLPADWSRE